MSRRAFLNRSTKHDSSLMFNPYIDGAIKMSICVFRAIYPLGVNTTPEGLAPVVY